MILSLLLTLSSLHAYAHEPSFAECSKKQAALEEEFGQLFVDLTLRFEELLYEMKKGWTTQQIEQFNEGCRYPWFSDKRPAPVESLLKNLYSVAGSKEAFEKKLSSRGEILVMNSELKTVQLIFNLRYRAPELGTLLVNVKDDLCGMQMESRAIFSRTPLTNENKQEFLKALASFAQPESSLGIKVLSAKGLIASHLPGECQSEFDQAIYDPSLAGQPLVP